MRSPRLTTRTAISKPCDAVQGVRCVLLFVKLSGYSDNWRARERLDQLRGARTVLRDLAAVSG